MASVARRRTVAAPPETLWAVAGDPWHRPRWWPSVARVEDVTEGAWTDVVKSSRGRFVRADFTTLEREEPRLLHWRLEVEASPFERFLVESEYRIALEPASAEATRVELWARQRMRGVSRLGALMARRASARQLVAALDGLERAVTGTATGEDGAAVGQDAT